MCVIEANQSCSNLSLTSFYQNAFGLQYYYTFEFENNFDYKSKLLWMRERRYLPFYVTFIYLAAICGLQRYMKNKKPFDLRIPLVLWNATLAIFNVFSSIRAVPNFIDDLTKFGVQFTLCSSRYCDNITLLWAWMFTVSKYFELGDTLFIVLRKRNLIFLHWYHHVTVLVMTWFVFLEMAVPARAMWTMNASVHAIMYSYYTLVAMRFKVSRVIAMSITTIQIAQMFGGIYIAVFVYYLREKDAPCLISDTASNVIFVIYFSYLLLFLNYFYKTYIARVVADAVRTKKEA